MDIEQVLEGVITLGRDWPGSTESDQNKAFEGNGLHGRAI
jgi:hypothetical protein